MHVIIKSFIWRAEKTASKVVILSEATIDYIFQYVWDIVICKQKHLKIETVKTENSMKYLTDNNSNMPSLAYIVGLLE